MLPPVHTHLLARLGVQGEFRGTGASAPAPEMCGRPRATAWPSRWSVGPPPRPCFSLSAGARAESRLGGPRGVGPGHAPLAVRPTGPVEAVPPAPTHRGPSQHRLPARGQDSQRLHPEFSGVGPAGEWASVADNPGGGLGAPAGPWLSDPRGAKGLHRHPAGAAEHIRRQEAFSQVPGPRPPCRRRGTARHVVSPAESGPRGGTEWGTCRCCYNARGPNRQ